MFNARHKVPGGSIKADISWCVCMAVAAISIWMRIRGVDNVCPDIWLAASFVILGLKDKV